MCCVMSNNLCVCMAEWGRVCLRGLTDSMLMPYSGRSDI